MYIYIYIYICLCVCVCVFSGDEVNRDSPTITAFLEFRLDIVTRLCL